MHDFIRRALLLMVGITLPMEALGAVRILGYPATVNKISTAMLLLFAFVTWPLTGRTLPWNRKHPWVLAFGVGIVVSAGVSLTYGIVATSMLPLLTSYAAVILFYFLLHYTITSGRDLRVLATGLALGTVWSVAAGFIFPSEEYLDSGRFTGSQAGPNGLAMNLSASLPLLLLMVFTTRSRVAQIGLWGTIVIAVGGIVAALSRSAYVSVAAMGVMWTLRFGRGANSIKLMIPAIVLALGVAVLAPQSFRDRLGTLSSEGRAKDLSIQKRSLMNYWGLQAFLSNPITGVGFGRVGIFANQRDQRIGPLHTVHHTYLQVASNSGALALIPLIAITILTWLDFTLVWKTCRAPPNRSDPVLSELYAWAVLLQISFLSCLVGAQFHSSIRAKVFWLLMSLSSVLVTLARDRLLELRASPTAAAQPTGAPEPVPPWIATPARPTG